MKNPEKNVDLSCYVALGDSISAGYTDAALYHDAQLKSFPYLLAVQFRLAGGGGEFRQALVPKSSVGIGFNGNARVILKACPENESELCFLAEGGDLSVLASNLYSEQGPFHNLGIPAAKSFSLLYPGYGNPGNGPGNYNPFFTRTASDPSTASIISDALKLNPSFFTLLIGNNDVLIYAVKGGTADSITPVMDFRKSLAEILLPFVSRKIKGAIATLPDILSIPFFTTIPYNGLYLSSDDVKEMDATYIDNEIRFHEGNNPFVVEDKSIKKGLRQLKDGELVLYDIFLDQNRDKYLKGSMPLPEKYFLSTAQVLAIRRTILQYNDEIKSAARPANLALVDLHEFLLNATTDRTYDSKRMKLRFGTSGVFSLDGLHVNALGQALLANEFIKAINATYNSSIPTVNLLPYRHSYNVVMNR